MPSKMKALVKSRDEEGLWMEEVPIPEIGANDVLIKVIKTSICGTDLHIYKWDQWARNTITVPMVVGHEFVGSIVDVGSEVSEYKVGQRVSGEGHLVCGYCRNCRAGRSHLCHNTIGVGVHRPGAFAEYIALPKDNIIRIPSDISDDIASLLDPLGNAVHTALSFDLVGEDVLVTGAGPIGIMGALVAQQIGARKVVITDINSHRLKLAKKLGVQHTVDVTKHKLKDVMRQLDMDEGFDIGLEMSGVCSAMRDMIDVLNNGGKIAVLGIASTSFEIDWNKVVFKMLSIKGIYGREMFETWYKMIALLQGNLDIEGIITSRLSCDDYLEGFKAMNNGDSGKVILSW